MESYKIKHVNILMVEDNPGDIRLLKEVFIENCICNTLNIAVDGDQAIKFLYQKDEYQNAPKPDLILLDLNLPKMSGREVLDEINADENLKQIPVVVMTSSDEEEELIKSTHLQVKCFVIKPIDFEKISCIIKTLDDIWFSVVHMTL
jgi:CheY-like chemotaxis protein